MRHVPRCSEQPQRDYGIIRLIGLNEFADMLYAFSYLISGAFTLNEEYAMEATAKASWARENR